MKTFAFHQFEGTLEGFSWTLLKVFPLYPTSIQPSILFTTYSISWETGPLTQIIISGKVPIGLKYVNKLSTAPKRKLKRTEP